MISANNYKEITLSVRDLVRTHSTPHKLLSPFPLPQRGMLGREAQVKVQQTHTSQPDICHTEIYLRRTFSYLDHLITVQGRIDSLVKRSDLVEIEEIKSVILSPGAFKSIKRGDFPDYEEQLQFYALLYQDENPGVKIKPILILYNLIEEKMKRLQLPFNQKKIRSLIYQRFAEVIQKAHQDNYRCRRQVESLDRVDFSLPEQRPQQEEMRAGVRQSLEEGNHLLISAPTGTGKTAAILYPALQYAIRNRKRLFFAVPKTTQQAIVRKTLAPLIDQGLEQTVCFLRASRRMCANDIFFCHTDYCPYARAYQDETERSKLIQELLQEKLILPDVLFDKAKARGLCPSALMFDVAVLCDVLVGDYNYIFDPRIQVRHLFQTADLTGWILIIDEAHNLYDRAISILSPALGFRQVKDLLKSIINKKIAVYKRLYKCLKQIDGIFRQLEDEGRHQYPNQACFIHSLNISGWQDALRDYESAFINYLFFKIRKNLLILEDPFEAFYYHLKDFVHIAALNNKAFIPFYQAGKPGILKISCVDPSGYLHEQISRFHSVIAMSGSFDPINFYRKNLGFPDDRSQQIEIGSPFPAENRQIVIIPNINTYYKDRAKWYPVYAKTIADIAGLHQGNYMVFCPSFEFLQYISLFLNTPDFEVLRQRPGMPEAERNEIFRRMRSVELPCILLAVMGGIFSEGIDLPGDSVIGVIIFSPALPPVSFERELIRTYYDEKNGLGSETAYIYPGINKVIQSVGRLIRTAQDKGIIVLAGERFARDEISQLFPDYWFEKSGDVIITEAYLTCIEQFWRRFD